MVSLCTDEHVPSVFITTLRSDGHEVTEARDVFGESTNDEQLLRYCGEHGYLFVTQDKKDFAEGLSDTVDHAGILLYTDSGRLRHEPEEAVRTLERIVAHYPPADLQNAVVWLDQWRE